MKFWRALCETLERPQWIERHWTRGLLPGSAESMALRAELAALFASRPWRNGPNASRRVDACVTPVLRLDELGTHPCTRASTDRRKLALRDRERLALLPSRGNIT